MPSCISRGPSSRAATGARLKAVNQNGTAAVVRAVPAAGVSQLVHMSSVGAYSRTRPHPVHEDWPTNGVPSSSYSVDKGVAERIVAGLQDSPTRVTVVRPSLILQDAAVAEIARYFVGPLLPGRSRRR